MNAKKVIVLLLLSVLTALYPQDTEDDPLGLSLEYSKDYFESGIRALHATRYELAISEFIKSLSYKDSNHLSRLYLGEAYRKAGYERNALYTWNTLTAMGYESRFLKNRISYLYNRRGMLSDIYIDKNYIIRTELKGYYEGNNYTTFLNPSQIAVDKANNYYVSSFSTGSVVQLDANLQVKRTILTANPLIGKPFGVAVAKNGEVFISDFGNDRILKVNQMNIVTQTIGYKGIGEGGLLGPEYLALDEYDNLYVVDSGNVRINKYSPEGIALFSFGNKGDKKLESPGGMYYKDGFLYVVDRKLHEIFVYDASGNFVRSFGSGYLYNPYDITMDKLGRYIVVCAENIWIYEPESSLWYILDSIGTRLRRGISVLTDNEDNILVADYNRSTVYVLSLERRRYNNMFVNVERVLSSKYPSVHLLVDIRKDDLTVPVGLTDRNLTIFENGKRVNAAGMGYMDLLNRTAQIAILYDNTAGTQRFKNEFSVILNSWMSSLTQSTGVSLTQSDYGKALTSFPSGSTRLELLDGISAMRSAPFSDKGDMFRKAMNDLSDRFARKSIVLVTDSSETGSDFEALRIEDIVQFALNNDIKIYVVSFSEGTLSGVYKNMASRTGGDYYTVYKRSDLKDLFSRIENRPSDTMVVSYVSDAVSRFGREPVRVEVEVNYSGMKGLGDTVYFPPRK